jgi:hypothetical protein
MYAELALTHLGICSKQINILSSDHRQGIEAENMKIAF